MSVRFIIGRAGSGKTWRCLEAIRARLRDDSAAGPRLLLIVPEQASFQMERALIETPDVPGFMRCEVLSFRRLAYRVFTETGADPRRSDQTIGGLGRLMVIRRLIRQERDGLRLLGQVADKPGLVGQVAHAFDELMREEVLPDQLDRFVKAAEGEHPLAAARLADLTRLYRAYLDYLTDDRLDPAQYLTLAADRLDACSWLGGAEVWVDGFAGLTRQEYHLLTSLARRVASMEITLLMDPAASVIDADPPPGPSYSLFSRSERTLMQLRRAFLSAGVVLDEAVRLHGRPDPADSHRRGAGATPEGADAGAFSKRPGAGSRAAGGAAPSTGSASGPGGRTRFAVPALGLLEQRLFLGAGDASESTPAPDVVRVLEFPDRRTEVEAAVAEIARLTREADPPMRYRDIAIIVRDLAVYHDLVSATMAAHQMPCFIDRREPTTHHPLVELVRGLLAIAVDDCRLDSVRLLLKTGLLPLADEEADLLENYLIAHGIAGRRAWGEPWSYTRIFRGRGEDGQLTAYQREVLTRMNALREQWLAAVGPWLEAVAEGGEMPGRRWGEMLYACLERLGVGERLYAWADEAEADGRADEAGAHRQVWADFIELLDEFVRALGDDAMRADAFRETLEAALSGFDLGLAPATLDQVLVGAIERSRHPSIRAALLLGFDEHHYPMRRGEDPLIGDAERDLLEGAGVEIGPSRRRRLLDERMLAYIALTRAGERLWISYPRIESDGKQVHPSPYLDDVCAALPGLAVERVGDPGTARDPARLTRVGRLGGALAAEFRDRPVLADEQQPAIRARWNAVYEAARRQQDWQHTLRRALGGLAYRNAASLPPGMMDRWVRQPFTTSVSRLEKFAACPFAHFAGYVLRLEPRVEFELGALDLGNLCHAILEAFIGRLASEGRRLADLADDEIATGIDEAAERILPRLTDELLLAEARHAFMFDRHRGHLGRVMRWQRDAARVGRFRPLAVEYPFGIDPTRYPPLTLTTPGGRTIHLRGKIDRVDVAELGDELVGAVIDYKRSRNRRLNLAEVYHGLALQLVGYLLALQQTGESLAGRPIRPVAAMYLSLIEPYAQVSHPDAERKSGMKWRGVLEREGLKTLDEMIEPGTGSAFFAARLKKDGDPDARGDVAGRAELAALMHYVGRRMGELADRLLDGDIAVSPYRLNKRMPCGYCEFRSVCRYEIETQAPRTLDLLTRPDAFARIRAEAADG